MTELFRWYLARMRRDAQQRSARQKLTPMTLVNRDNARIQELIAQSGRNRSDRSEQFLKELQQRNKSPLHQMMNAAKLVEEQHKAMAMMLAALGVDADFDADTSLTLEQVAQLVVEQLEQARQGERLIADSTPDLLCCIDENLTIKEINLEFELTTKYQKLSVLTAPLESLIPPNDQPVFRAHLEKRKAGSTEDQSMECALRAADGETIDLEWHIDWSPTAGEYFCQARNIAERKQRQRLQAEVTAMINHDLRVPVTGLRTVMENGLNGVYGAISQAGTARFTQALGTIEHMLVLINQLLDAEKLQAGEMNADIRPTSMRLIYDRCADIARPLLGDRSLKIPTQSTLAVNADVDQVCRVLSNLLSNALKFASESSTIEVKEESKLGRSVVISVSDNGPGIADDLKPFVFDRYKAGQGGTGLGLYIARKLTELQGGEIGFTSESGAGTTFWFSLPQVAPVSNR